MYAVALRNVIHTYVLRKKGPVYVSMFKPLGMVIAVFLGVTILGDILHLGRYNSFVYFILKTGSSMLNKRELANIITTIFYRTFLTRSANIILSLEMVLEKGISHSFCYGYNQKYSQQKVLLLSW